MFNTDQNYHQAALQAFVHSKHCRAYQLGAIDARIIVMVVIVSLALAGGAYWYFNSDKVQYTANGMAIETTPAQFITCKDIIVNVISDDTGEMHFMQLDVTLMTRNEKTYETMETNLPVVRNAILDSLATWSFEEVIKPENRELLRLQLLNAIKELNNLPYRQGVNSVLITNMVVQ